MTETANSTTKEPRSVVLTVQEVARAFSINRTTVLSMIERGDLPGARRIGAGHGRWRIPRSAHPFLKDA